MTQSLSVVLPVRDAQASLRRTTEAILEVVPELTDEFEIVVVDDASTDLTEEVAQDLAHEYPQMRVLRHRASQGMQQAAQTGVEQCRGDVIFIKDDAAPIRASDLHSLWGMREDEELVMAQSDPTPPTPVEPKPLDPSLIARLMNWGASLEQAENSDHTGRIQMIRRQAVTEMQHGSTEDAEVDAPLHTVADGEVSISDQIRRRMPPRPIPSTGIY